MSLVQQLLIALRTLTEDDPQPSRARRKKSNNSRKSTQRNNHALILTFRDLFTTGGLNTFLDEMDVNSRPRRRNCRSSFPTDNKRERARSPNASESKADIGMTAKSQMTPYAIPIIPDPQDETVPLLQEDAEIVPCTDLIVSPLPVGGFLSSLKVLPKKGRSKPTNLTVPLRADNENKTVETLRKVLKWSPRKRNVAKFAVPLPREDEHVALAVVQNAVNIVKEEQQHKRKRKFLWLKLC